MGGTIGRDSATIMDYGLKRSYVIYPRLCDAFSFSIESFFVLRFDISYADLKSEHVCPK